MKIAKTNAVRLLDRLGIRYSLASYPVDESDLSARHLADTLGLDIARIFKTLVLRGDKTGHIVCVIPGGDELDLKKAAKVSGNKSAAMIPMKDLQAVTGYVRGGCSPLAMKKAFPTFVHESALAHDSIYVSAGQRGLQINLAPGDLITAAAAKTAALVHESPTDGGHDSP